MDAVQHRVPGNRSAPSALSARSGQGSGPHRRRGGTASAGPSYRLLRYGDRYGPHRCDFQPSGRRWQGLGGGARFGASGLLRYRAPWPGWQPPGSGVRKSVRTMMPTALLSRILSRSDNGRPSSAPSDLSSSYAVATRSHDHRRLGVVPADYWRCGSGRQPTLAQFRCVGLDETAVNGKPSPPT